MPLHGLVIPASGSSQDPLGTKEERYTVFSFFNGVLLVVAAVLASLVWWRLLTFGKGHKWTRHSNQPA